MTTKNPGKVQQEPRRAQAPSAQDLQMAYHAHTLAQALYGQLAMTYYPWIGQAPPPAPHASFVGPQLAPWAMQWPPMWGAGPFDPVMGPGPQMSSLHGFPNRAPMLW